MKRKAKLVLGLTILFLAGLIGAIVYACSIEGPKEVGLDYYSRIPAIVIGRPIAFLRDSTQQARYIDFEVKGWVKGNQPEQVIRLRYPWSYVGCDLLEFFRDTTTYYFLPLYYYTYYDPAADSSYFTIPRLFHAFISGQYKPITRDSIVSFSEVSIIRHIIRTQSHPFEVSLSIPDTAFVPGKPLRATVSVRNATPYELAAPDSSKIDFLVEVYDETTRIATFEGIKRESWRERIWWLPYEKENQRKFKPGESINYIIDLSQRFFELSSFSYGSQRTLKINALLNYYLIPLYGHSVRTDTLSLPFGTVTSVETDNVPTTFHLSQNYPNPFNPSTTISFDIPTRSHVTLKIFNVLGQEVATLVNGEVETGRHQVRWNAEEFPSAVYLYRLRANDFLETKKMLLIR